MEEEVIVINTDRPPPRTARQVVTKRGPGRPKKAASPPLSSGAPVSTRIKGSGVSDAQAAGTIAKLLVVLTLILMYGRLKRAKVPDHDGTLAETLAMTDEEAYEVAKPIARFGNSSPTGARIIGPVVRNEDVIGAVFAIYEWNRRVDEVLRKLSSGEVAPNLPREANSRVVAGPIQEDRPVSGGGGEQPGVPWGSPFDEQIV